jgi:hypothetical protein
MNLTFPYMVHITEGMIWIFLLVLHIPNMEWHHPFQTRSDNSKLVVAPLLAKIMKKLTSDVYTY